MGNSAGVLGEQPIPHTLVGNFISNIATLSALVYNGINSSVDAWRGHHDVYGSMAAGGLTGALYKSTGNFRVPYLACRRKATAGSILGRFTD